MKNAINWFEIPSTDFERATAFYNALLNALLRVETFNGIPNAVFPYNGHGDESVGGSVIHNPMVKPSADGVVPYLNVNGIMDAALARVESAGGKILLPKTDMGMGSIAIILDTEGNRIGLHSY